MNSMYLLSLLLTADLGKAEEGFVSGFEDCVETPCVFREWGTISGSAFDYSECKSHLAPSQERGSGFFLRKIRKSNSSHRFLGIDIPLLRGLTSGSI